MKALTSLAAAALVICSYTRTSVGVVVAASEESSPVCSKTERRLDVDDAAHQQPEDDAKAKVPSVFTCPVWEMLDGWLVAGQKIGRNQPVPGLRQDLIIPWKQHSRRAFPLWGRHQYFYRNAHAKHEHNDELHFFFAPGLRQVPLECHRRYANLLVDYKSMFHDASTSSNKVSLNPQIVTDRAVAKGDPLFLPCVDSDDERSLAQAFTPYEDFPPANPADDSDAPFEDSFCVDPYNLEIRNMAVSDNHDDDSSSSSSSATTTINTAATTGSSATTATSYYGAFAGRAIPKGASITWGRFIHMHRSELRDPSNGGRDELLLNYCFGQPKSSLLLLPLVPIANAMNHAGGGGGKDNGQQTAATANVRIKWSNGFDPDLFFSTMAADEEAEDASAPTTTTTEALFREDEKSPQPLAVEYVALRDIEPGEELLLDYGSAWQDAWDEHVKAGGDAVAEFRHEIGLPDGMLPTKWLEKEVLKYTDDDFPVFLLPTLQVAELSPVELSSGEKIEGQIDRIGLPEGLTEKMAAWAEEIGLTDIMRSYVLGDLSLPVEGDQRLRLNGATWWMKRFPDYWKADMHYISPDDHEANNQFMQALSDAGFDQVLEAIGKKDGLDSITVYYPSFIAVSHCTGSNMHSDSTEDGHFNVIFPVLQVENSSGPELIMGDDKTGLYVPYKYERDHAVVLGKDGLHGTAPCDYNRGGPATADQPQQPQMRMVVSVYMVDADNPATRSAVLDEWEGSDPPFPLPPDRPDFLDNYKHWKRDDPNRSLSSPLLEEQ